MELKTKTFAEQIALVTGGGTGIGRAFTQVLATSGVRVIIASRRKAVLEQTADEINVKLGIERVFPHAFDVRDFEQTTNLVHVAMERFGAIDILINNCGLAVPETVDAITDEGWDTVMETNLRGAMRLIRAVLPNMIAEDFGDIINVASQAAKHGYADVPSYCASKFGLLGFAESVRDHIRKIEANIRIFNFCPGLVDVETPVTEPPRGGFIHVANLAKALMFVLSLDRNVVIEDLNLYAR
ncbi:MAG: SDR family NAD(P)-dependent oxidoreductase [Acidobacteriota bacterium]